MADLRILQFFQRVEHNLSQFQPSTIYRARQVIHSGTTSTGAAPC
jgi:hypothetical protein